MRAKTVNFERGKDPKTSMEIGNQNLRNVKYALENEDWKAPALQSMIDGLEEGSVNPSLADELIDRSIRDVVAGHSLLWYEWYDEDHISYWNTDSEEYIIEIDPPGFFEDLKIICKILSIKSFQDFEFKIEAYCDIDNTKHFEQEHVFEKNDEAFDIRYVINDISRVAEATVKNIE